MPLGSEVPQGEDAVVGTPNEPTEAGLHSSQLQSESGWRRDKGTTMGLAHGSRVGGHGAGGV